MIHPILYFILGGIVVLVIQYIYKIAKEEHDIRKFEKLYKIYRGKTGDIPFKDVLEIIKLQEKAKNKKPPCPHEC